jgi:hypothetical protein
MDLAFMLAMFMLVTRAIAKELDPIGTKAMFSVIAVQQVGLPILALSNFLLEAFYIITNNQPLSASASR